MRSSGVGLRSTAAAYELPVSVNRIVMAGADHQAFGLITRAAAARREGGGLTVVNLRAEAAAGVLLIRSEKGRVTDFLIPLPMYRIDSYLFAH